MKFFKRLHCLFHSHVWKNYTHSENNLHYLMKRIHHHELVYDCRKCKVCGREETIIGETYNDWTRNLIWRKKSDYGLLD